jgi:hypothetical protein
MIHTEKVSEKCPEKSRDVFFFFKLRNEFERARNLLEMREVILSCVIMDAYTLQNIFVKNF